MYDVNNRIEILSYKPHRVTYRRVDNDKTYNVPRRRFEQKLDLGFYEVVNPKALPSFFDTINL